MNFQFLILCQIEVKLPNMILRIQTLHNRQQKTITFGQDFTEKFYDNKLNSFRAAKNTIIMLYFI